MKKKESDGDEGREGANLIAAYFPVKCVIHSRSY